jgi:hypothetical protein
MSQYHRPWFIGPGGQPAQSVVTDMQYPQSLGELCIEVAQDTVRWKTCGGKPPGVDVMVNPETYSPVGPLKISSTAEIRALRGTLWRNCPHRDLGQFIDSIWKPTYAQAFQFARIIEKSKIAIRDSAAARQE